MVGFREGQVLNFKYNNPVSNTISSLMGDYWTHTAIIYKVEGDNIEIIEAMGTYRDEKYNPKGIYKKIKFLLKIKQLFSGKVNINTYSREFLSRLHKENRLKIMDFKADTSNLVLKLNAYQNIPYDYFGVFNIGIKKILSLFGKTYSGDIESSKKLFCSELVGRYLNDTTNFNILDLANKKSFEEVRPQDISLVYDKLKFYYKV